MTVRINKHNETPHKNRPAKEKATVLQTVTLPAIKTGARP